MQTESINVWDGKTLAALFSDIYSSSTTRKRQIDTLINALSPLIKNPSDAALIIPLIADYLDVSVKNDDALVKIAGIVQRLVTGTGNQTIGNADGMTDEERTKLLQELHKESEDVKKELDSIDTEISNIKKKQDETLV